MDRLTELMNGEYIADCIYHNVTDDNGDFPYDGEGIDMVVKRLGEYEELDEQGLLLMLPCKVGDTVYCIEDKKIWDCIIDKVTISRTNGIWFEIKTPKSMPDISAIEYTENDFGRTIFLTKEEAEQKLKEMED